MGVFGVCSRNECATDLFFGTDYHSHFGARRGGMATFDGQHFHRAIHNIENAAFRAKFESDIPELPGFIGIGCISADYPQPIVLHSKIGAFAVVTTGRINNKEQLAKQLIAENNIYYTELSGGRINDTELVASLICRKDNIVDGMVYAGSVIEGSMTMLVCTDGKIYAARDRLGRTPLSIGKKEDGYCVSFESFAYINLGYNKCRELGPGEIVEITADKEQTVVKPGEETRICTFLWSYYGYPTSVYEGVNVEEMRQRCGCGLAKQDELSNLDIDYVAGIPDSGTAHAIGYANQSGLPFARPLIKYTPTWTRSFTPHNQSLRELTARMKLIPINSLIEDKKLLFIEDSIIRGTQMRGVVDFLHSFNVRELHIRSACPPVLYSCKYLNFTFTQSENEYISRQVINELEGTDGEKYIKDYTERGTKRYKNMVEIICKKLNLTTLDYHSLDSLLESVGINKCKLCTYCWNGAE